MSNRSLRERIVTLTDQGMSTADIAARLDVSLGIVKYWQAFQRSENGIAPALHTPWSDTDDALLRKLHRDGQSYAAIAITMGRSRNSVLGRAHRIKLPARAIIIARPRHDPMKRLPRKPPAKRAPPARGSQGEKLRAILESGPVPSTDDASIEASARVKLVDLTNSSCRWPLGDPHAPDFGFCPHQKVPGLPYCAGHSARAYAPPVPRKPRNYHRGKIANIQQTAVADAGE